MRGLENANITTIEGLQEWLIHPCRKPEAGQRSAMWLLPESGQMMQAASLLKDKPKPTDQEIDSAMQGNICRCGTYQRIRQAIHIAAGVRA